MSIHTTKNNKATNHERHDANNTTLSKTEFMRPRGIAVTLGTFETRIKYKNSRSICLVLHKEKKRRENKLVPSDWLSPCCGRSLADFLHGKIIHLNILNLFFLSGRTFTSPAPRLLVVAVFPLFVASASLVQIKENQETPAK